MDGQVTVQDVNVRPLAEADLPEAGRVMRLAFGTFLTLLEPMAFMGNGDYVRSRWRADPTAALAVEADSRVVGSNFATQWGSVGFFGPLTVHPSLWDRGIGRRLLARTMEIMDGWGLSHAGLSTFGHSPKHISLYQAFGFLPRFLMCFVKFAAARAAANFERLVEACERFAANRGAARLVAGMSTARRGAYRILLQRRFTADSD